MRIAAVYERKDVTGLPSMRERLQRYPALRLENENRLEKLERLRTAAEMPPRREADGSAHTGSSGDRMARAVERYLEYERQIRPLIEANRREMAAIRTAVESLTDPLEREVLRLRYIDTDGFRLTRWRDVAVALYGDDDAKYIMAAHRLHENAICTLHFV